MIETVFDGEAEAWVYLKEQAFQALRIIYWETISVLIREDSYQIRQNLIWAPPSEKRYEKRYFALETPSSCLWAFPSLRVFTDSDPPSSLSLTLGAGWRWTLMGGVVGVP